jgi:hypothetical protein
MFKNILNTFHSIAKPVQNKKYLNCLLFTKINFYNTNSNKFSTKDLKADSKKDNVKINLEVNKQIDKQPIKNHKSVIYYDK